MNSAESETRGEPVRLDQVPQRRAELRANGFRVGLLVAVVTIAAAWAVGPALFRVESWDATKWFFLVIVAVAGMRPIRIASLETEFTPIHPLILVALVRWGPAEAAAAGLAGVLGAKLLRDRAQSPMKTVFNFAGISLSIWAASQVFLLSRGGYGQSIQENMLPLILAGAMFYVFNSGLVALAISVDRRRRFFQVWRESFAWALPGFLLGPTLAVVILMAMDRFSLAALIWALPITMASGSFYWAHRQRLAEKQRRIDQVEEHKAQLERKIYELKQAVERLKQLEGLLAICSYCKSIRDDKQQWHRLENYLESHSDVRFTHGICECCMQKIRDREVGA